LRLLLRRCASHGPRRRWKDVATRWEARSRRERSLTKRAQRQLQPEHCRKYEKNG
jgi:hypothetical protein